MEETDPKTDARVRVMLEHLGGRLTATQAALDLGVSRKTFYEWLDRAREAMRLALTDRPGGRPPKPVDPEKDQLHEQVDTLEKERLVLESRLRIQKAFQETLDALGEETSPKKKE
jgi:transposase